MRDHKPHTGRYLLTAPKILPVVTRRHFSQAPIPCLKSLFGKFESEDQACDRVRASEYEADHGEVDIGDGEAG